MATQQDDIDLETCSWCLTEVPDSTLKEIAGGDGARLCAECRYQNDQRLVIRRAAKRFDDYGWIGDDDH